MQMFSVFIKPLNLRRIVSRSLVVAGELILFGAAAWCVPSASAQSPGPNIVYILADDMGLGDVRSYTPTSAVDTPNIDRIASAGMQFTNAHGSDSVCTPSRYALLTGQYAWRSALQTGVLLPFAAPLIPSSRLTVGEMLQSSGYSTGMFGKWHLGSTWATTDGKTPATNGSNVDFTQPMTNGPVDRGFDTFVGVEGSANYPPYAFVHDRQVVGNDLTTPTIPTGQVYGNPSNSGVNSIGPIAPNYDITNLLPTITNAADSYISSKANQAQPFFSYVALTAPHEPLVPPSSSVVGDSGYSGPKQSYANFIWSVDWAVGQILNTINDPNHDGDTSDSIANNTLIVFTSDNGATTQSGFSTSPGFVNGVPLRGDKSTIYEGGSRIPFVAQWAGHIPAGTVNNHMIELTDFMSTAAAITGNTVPTTAGEDSINILPELLGMATQSVRSLSIEHSTNGSLAIHQSDSAGTEWKLAFTAGDGSMGDTKKYDPTVNITDFTKVQLYNLSSDPGEQTNLLSGGGSLGAQQKALQLQKYLQTFMFAGRSANLPPKTIVNGSATEVGETTILVDFGQNAQETTQQGVTWNNYSGGSYTRPTITKGLYDQGGGYTGIVMQSKFVNPTNAVGVNDPSLNYSGPYPAALAGIPQSALQDGFYVSDGNKLILTLSSLDAHATYDFLFYGAAKNFLFETLYTVNGSNMGQDQIAVTNKNATSVGIVNGIAADQFGQITVTIEGRQADGSLENPNVLFDAGGQLNFMRIIEHLQIIPGDYNGDRIVDSADYAAWRSAFGATGINPADGNHDGVVDMQDYVIWRAEMEAESLPGGGGGASTLGSGSNTQAVPEPHVATLIFAAVTLFWGGRRPGRRFCNVAGRADLA